MHAAYGNGMAMGQQQQPSSQQQQQQQHPQQHPQQQQQQQQQTSSKLSTGSGSPNSSGYNSYFGQLQSAADNVMCRPVH